MKFESIYLVTNLAGYDFGNAVLLADDVNTIVLELLGASDRDCVECCEKMLFLGHILGCALDASRRVEKNYDVLEELLRVNWGEGSEAERKWAFVRDVGCCEIVNRIARRILMGQDGEKCLGIVKAFYKKFSNKDEFKKVFFQVRKGLVWKQAALDYLHLRESTADGVSDTLEILIEADKMLSSDPTEAIKNASEWNLTSLVELVDTGSTSSEMVNKILAGIMVHIQIGNEQYLKRQLDDIKTLVKDPQKLVKYQDLISFPPFYEVNVALLKLHHQKLHEKDLMYDTYTILLCHLIYGKSQSGQFLKDFLNEQTFGDSENFNQIMAELQNFGS